MSGVLCVGQRVRMSFLMSRSCITGVVYSSRSTSCSIAADHNGHEFNLDYYTSNPEVKAMGYCTYEELLTHQNDNVRALAKRYSQELETII